MFGCFGSPCPVLAVEGDAGLGRKGLFPMGKYALKITALWAIRFARDLSEMQCDSLEICSQNDACLCGLDPYEPEETMS